MVCVLLSAENKKQFFIPKNFAHGFLVLSDHAEFAYKCTDFYHPNDEGGLSWKDPDINVQWPIPEGMELTFPRKIRTGVPSENTRRKISRRIIC